MDRKAKILSDIIREGAQLLALNTSEMAMLRKGKLCKLLFLLCLYQALKSLGGNTVPVRFRLRAPYSKAAPPVAYRESA